MFRCPSCAKVWKIPLSDSHVLLAQQNMEQWSIQKEPISLFSKVCDVKDMFDLGEKLIEHWLSMPMLPECPSCGEAHDFEEWKKAWELPGDYFDADNLCHCGGELWYDRIPNSSRYALVCDACEWVKPKHVISGHEGD